MPLPTRTVFRTVRPTVVRQPVRRQNVGSALRRMAPAFVRRSGAPAERVAVTPAAVRRPLFRPAAMYFNPSEPTLLPVMPGQYLAGPDTGMGLWAEIAGAVAQTAISVGGQFATAKISASATADAIKRQLAADKALEEERRKTAVAVAASAPPSLLSGLPSWVPFAALGGLGLVVFLSRK